MRWAEQLQLNHYIKERGPGRVEGGVGGCGLEEEEPQCVQSVHTLPLLFPLPEGSPNSLQLADFLSLSHFSMQKCHLQETFHNHPEAMASCCPSIP